MTNGIAPSAIHGNTMPEPGWGVPLRFVFPLLSAPAPYSDLPAYWSKRRDWVLATSVDKEDMWAAAVARTATKFAAHGYVIKDSKDSDRRVSASQELLKQANGGEGWVGFALKVIQDLLTTDNGIFIRVRRANEQIEKVRVKATAPQFAGTEGEQFSDVVVSSAAPGAKIVGLYHLDSLRCMRTGNLAYPVRYQALDGSYHLIRWDQLLMYADQPSPRAELFGVGRCAAGRCYKTIAKVGAMEQLVYESLAGGGANKLAFIQGISDTTLKGIITAAHAEQAAKNLQYYLGTILGAIPSDTPISIAEVRLKELLASFVPKDERDNAYLIYADNLGIPVQDIQPLSGQGLGTGTQTVILQEASQGIGTIPAFIKWWEQTVSDRILPATTELEFLNENDVRDQKAKADVALVRAQERSARIQSGEISPAMARQIAADVGDLAKDLVASDATPGGQLSDDEKPLGEAQPSPAAQQLIQGEPTEPPKAQAGAAMKAYDDLLDEELAMARRIAEAVQRG